MLGVFVCVGVFKNIFSGRVSFLTKCHEILIKCSFLIGWAYSPITESFDSLCKWDANFSLLLDSINFYFLAMMPVKTELPQKQTHLCPGARRSFFCRMKASGKVSPDMNSQIKVKKEPVETPYQRKRRSGEEFHLLIY